MKKIFICVESCQRRLLEANKVHTYLLKNGYEIVDNPKDANIIILVGCAASNQSAEYTLNKVKELQRYDAELIVAGCLPAIEKEKLAEIFDGKTISTKDLDKIDSLFPKNKIKFNSIDDENILNQNVSEEKSLPFIKQIGEIKKNFRNVEWMEKLYLKIKNHILKNLFGENSFIYRFLRFGDKPLYNITISIGCAGSCSYCAIKKAIGPLKSKPLDQCIKEFKNGLDEGYKDFVLNADDSGPYGLDIGSSFPELLDEITSIPGDYEISIRAFGPQWVIKYLNDLERILEKHKIKRMYIPMQSANNRILKLMNRYSDAEKMKDAFLRLKKADPDLLLNTHYILGFPTEGEEEFKGTMSFIKEINFSGGSIFPFIRRSGTESENIEPKISQKVISRRLRFAKKFLKKDGYTVIYVSKPLHVFVFDKRN